MPADAAPHGRGPAWHGLSCDDVLDALGADATVGLSSSEATDRLARSGPNRLPEPIGSTVIGLLLNQVRSPLIYLLLLAAGVALALGKTSDAIVIVVVVVLNALIGAFQEGRAQRSLEALRRLTSL